MRVLFLLFFLTACNLPENKKLTSESNKTLDSLKSELKLEQIQYGFTRTTRGNTDELKFKIILYDIDKKPTNYDSLNHVLFQAFRRSDYRLDTCDRVSIFYFSDYGKAKVWKIYYLDKDEKIQEIYYR